MPSDENASPRKNRVGHEMPLSRFRTPDHDLIIPRVSDGLDQLAEALKDKQ